MKVVYRNPYSVVEQELLIGDTTFVISGTYFEGEEETNAKPDLEIEGVSVIIRTTKGDFPIDVTKILEDVNSITWRKECNNDFFTYLSEKVISKINDA